MLSYNRVDLSVFNGLSILIVTGSSFSSRPKLWYCLSATLVCFFNYFPNVEYSNLLIVAAFSSKSFSGKASLGVKNSYLLRFSDNKAEISAVCLSEFYWALFCSVLLLIVLIFSLILIYNKFFLNCNWLSDDKVISFTKK